MNGCIRHITGWLSVLVLTGMLSGNAGGYGQDAPVWSAADKTGGMNGLSILRYGALGQGAYPYRTNAPASDMRVSLGGVPLRSRSPFGPDLDLIPAICAESATFDGWNTLAFALADSIPDEPITDTRFLMGSRQRFNLDMLYRRAAGDRAALTVSGSSTGMQGHYPPDTEAFIPKYNFRHYLVDYYREQGNGSRLHITARALRDRDEIADLDALQFMGERKLDEVTLSATLGDIPLSDTTTGSGTIYYIDSNTRFARYGLRKSLDENVFGFSAAIDKILGDTTYRLGLFHERTWFDSRVHRQSNRISESAVEGAFGYTGSRLVLQLDGAIRYRSDFEGGYRAAANIRYRIAGDNELILRGRSETVYPDIGEIYYAVPAFSDSSHTNLLYRGEVLEAETGFGVPVPGGRFELVAFTSRSDCPVFSPDVSTYHTYVARDIRLAETPPYNAARMVSVDGLTSSGARISLDMAFERWAAWELTSQSVFRTTNKPSLRWYYPQAESRLDGTVRRAFVDGKLLVAGYGSATVMHWDDGMDTAPAGTRFFLDAGISIRVATLELFYQTENLTSEDVYWFDVLQWQGRNSMYGGRWIFYR